MRKEIKKLRRIHDQMISKSVSIKNIVLSFEANLTKEERKNLSKELSCIQSAIDKFKKAIPRE